VGWLGTWERGVDRQGGEYGKARETSIENLWGEGRKGRGIEKKKTLRGSMSGPGEKKKKKAGNQASIGGGELGQEKRSAVLKVPRGGGVGG